MAILRERASLPLNLFSFSKRPGWRGFWVSSSMALMSLWFYFSNAIILVFSFMFSVVRWLFFSAWGDRYASGPGYRVGGLPSPSSYWLAWAQQSQDFCSAISAWVGDEILFAIEFGQGRVLLTKPDVRDCSGADAVVGEDPRLEGVSRFDFLIGVLGDLAGLLLITDDLLAFLSEGRRTMMRAIYSFSFCYFFIWIASYIYYRTLPQLSIDFKSIRADNPHL